MFGAEPIEVNHRTSSFGTFKIKAAIRHRHATICKSHGLARQQLRVRKQPNEMRFKSADSGLNGNDRRRRSRRSNHCRERQSSLADRPSDKHGDNQMSGRRSLTGLADDTDSVITISVPMVFVDPEVADIIAGMETGRCATC